MNKGIDKKEFWKERLERAKQVKHLQYSVYEANDTWWKLINDSHERILKRYVRATDRVLDAGCAYGRLSPLFENYVGIDFSPDFIEEARRLYPTKTFLVENMLELPFQKNEFDWGIVISVKNMIIGNLGKYQWDLMEKELKRVCKRVLILEYGDYESYRDNDESISKYQII